MSIVFVGIDLAKNVFALHGVNAAGAVLLRQPKVARAKLDEVVAALPACTMASKPALMPITGLACSLPTATPSS